MTEYFKIQARKQGQLFRNIKRKLPELKKLLKKMNDHWYGEDHIYRFYHSSSKIYPIQDLTEEIVRALKSLAPKDVTFNDYFEEIYKQGTRKKFSSKHNLKWTFHTRPMVEAFFHAKFFLEMVVKYGSKLETVPKKELPSGWALILYFYNLR
jgi:hypothetical protein